jgi:hypothetical protein
VTPSRYPAGSTVPLDLAGLKQAFLPLRERFRQDCYAYRLESDPHPTGGILKPLLDAPWDLHFGRTARVGGYFLRPGDSSCRVSCFDLDSHDGQMSWLGMLEVARRLLNALAARGVLARCTRSGGGAGLHVWIFWAPGTLAAGVRQLMRQVLTECKFKDGTGGVLAGQVEVFPKQDALAEGAFGNMCYLPGAGRSGWLDPVFLELTEDWTLMPADYWSNLPDSTLPEAVKLVPTSPPQPAKPGGREDPALVRSLLAAIPNDADTPYDRWFTVAASVHHALGDEAGHPVFVEWSARSPKHDEAFLDARVWPYLGKRSGGANTIGTLAYLARQAGWRPPTAFQDWTERAEDAVPPVTDVFNLETVIMDAPAGAVPAALGQLIRDWAGANGLDPNLGVWAFTFGALACIPLSSVLEIRQGYVTKPIYWSACVAEPSTGKTPAGQAGFAPLKEINRDELARWRMTYAAWEAQKAALSGGALAAWLLGNPEPQRNLPLVDDTTTEVLQRRLAACTSKVVWFVDELSSIMAMEGRYTAKGSGDVMRTFKLTGWTGGDKQVERVVRGFLDIRECGFDTAGGIQLDVLKRHMAEGRMQDDGYIPRFYLLPASPTRALPPRSRSHPATDLARYLRAGKLLHSLPPATYTFEPEAQRVFSEFTAEMTTLARGSHEALEKFHLFKGETLTARLALGYHLIEHAWLHADDPFAVTLPPAEPAIPLATLERAIAFMRWEASTHRNLIGGEQATTLRIARGVVGVLIRSATQGSVAGTVSRQALYQGTFAFRDADERERATALQYLHDIGVLRGAVETELGAWRRGQPSQWYVNPRVIELADGVAHQTDISKRREDFYMKGMPSLARGASRVGVSEGR